MALTIWKHRANLTLTQQRLKEGKLTIGFIGASITDARPRHNWPEPVIAWLVEIYPDCRIVVENAAIAATGSDLGVFRAQRDLIDRGCDLVFIDYSINDKDTPVARRRQTSEGLVRKLLAGGTRDLVLVHTFSQDMYAAVMDERYPPSIQDLEELAEHYAIGSIFMGLHSLKEVMRGQMRWEEWLPDGLHPTSRGSLSYAESVITFLKQELGRKQETSWELKRTAAIATPLDDHNWEKVWQLPLTEVATEGPWTLRRWPFYEWIDQVLETAAVGAKLSFKFEGRGLALGFDFGKASAEFRYKLDGGEWITVQRDRPDWLGDDGWFRLCVLSDEWSQGSHHIEIEVIHGDVPGCRGTNFRLATIGVID
jgi:hypothetical protein